jgi:DnaK suppressor protein
MRLIMPAKKKSKAKKAKVKSAKKVAKKKTVKKVAKLKNVSTPKSRVESVNINPGSANQKEQVKSSYSKEELEHFKQILLKKREEILEMLEAHKQSLIEATTQNDKPVGTPYSIHMEYGTETEEREKTMFFIAREEKMLNYIDAALMRIERGTYGVCIKCGKLIDKRRLEAVPHTQLCIECKLAQKKGF